MHKKTLIRINQEIGSNGKIINESSLDYALKQFKTTKPKEEKLAYLTRALLIDHIFEDGNKRTAFIICNYLFDDFDDERLFLRIKRITIKNIISIKNIERLLYGARN